MEKRGNLLIIFASLILIPFISAYGGYSTFSIKQFASVENILLGILFLAILFIVRKAMTKMFPRSEAAAIIIALVVSIMSVYGLTISNFSLEDFLYSIGINELFIANVGPWILLLFAAIVLWKLGLGGLLMVFGGIFIVLGFVGMATDSQVIYNWEFALGIGFVLFILGVIIRNKLHKKISIPGIKRPNLGNIKNPLKGGRLAVVIGGRRYPYPTFRKIPMTIQPGRGTRISVENMGSNDLLWKIKTKSGLKVGKSKTRGIIKPRMSEEIQIFSDSSSGTKFFTVSAIGRFGKVSRQRIHIVVKPTSVSPPTTPIPTSSGPTGPTATTPTGPKPKRKAMGEASLDVIVGGKSMGGSGSTTLDLTSSNTATITVKNGGTGGTLGWRASSNNELSLSKTSGKLAKGKMHTITINVKNRTGKENPAVIINGRGAGRTGGRATRGRVLVYFKVK